METIDDKQLEAFLSPGDGQPITADHREWMNAQIKATLDKKTRGELNYHSLDDVRRAFGLDAS